MLIGKCLKAAAIGPYFPDWEFPTLFGLTREQMKAIAHGWPLNATDPDTATAVRNTFSNLLGYPHRLESELELVASNQSSRASLAETPDSTALIFGPKLS